MGHYKLWAWQHTEYARIQILDADVLPLVDMDALFHLPGLAEAPFVGCPGKDSVLNAGWFSLKPDCEAFKRLTDLLWCDRGADIILRSIAPRRGSSFD